MIDPPPVIGLRRLALLLTAALCGCTGRYVRLTTEVAVVPTPERLERGAYLVNQLCACGYCHSGRDSGSVLDGESTTAFLGGGAVWETTAPYRSRIEMPNLTSDPATGLGRWTDDQILRAIRDGVDDRGNLLFPLMPFHAYQHMSDADAEAVVAYLRSVPKVALPKPRRADELPFMARLFLLDFGVAHHRPVHDVRAPPREDRIRYGEYVARLGACTECHSMVGNAPAEPGDPGYMGGSTKPFGLAGVGLVWASNLTPDVATGLGRYSADQIEHAIAEGRRLDGKRLAPPMSLLVPHVSGMSPGDLDALVAWLRSLPPVRHEVPARQLLPAAAAVYGAP